MKDASNYILSQLHTILSGNVVVDSETIPFYAITQDVAATDVNYCHFATVYEIPNMGTKDSFLSEYTVQLDVVSEMDNKAVSEKKVNDISNAVRVILKPNPVGVTVAETSDFKTLDIRIEEVRSFQDHNDGHWKIRKVLNINSKILQK